MASPSKQPAFKTYNDPVLVRIGFDTDTKTIKVTPDPFWIHPEEEVEWFCDLPHEHNKKHDHNCFTITFKNKPSSQAPQKSPFGESRFRGHGAHSGRAVVNPDINKLYDYSVDAPGFGSIDPQGGVKPTG